VIEPRIYRAAFIPAVLAGVVAMFSLESRPPPVPQALAADVLFDGRVALADANRLATARPDRRPGSPGDQATASLVASRLRSEHFAVTTDRFGDDGKSLVDVVGRRIGQSPRQLVIVAPRDADRVPDLAGSASDTAALLEIARTLEGRATGKTLVLASVDGSTLGSAGAQRLAGQLRDAGPVDAVVVVSDLGVPHARGSLIVPWGESTDRGGMRLQRTVAESVHQEVERGGAGRSPGTAGQFARLVLPIGIGDQAPFVDAGLDAVRLSGSGELPAVHQVAPSADRLGALGRATLRTVFAYDAAGPVDEHPASFLGIAQKNLPEWSVALLVFALLLPVLAASVDSLARVRRRREPVLPWLRWILAAAVPFLVTLALAQLLVIAGEAPDTASVPLPPRAHPLHGAGWVSLGLCLLVFAATWALVRPRLAAARGLPSLDSPGAAAALALLLSVLSLLVWAANPFAALALLPAVHLWLLVTGSPVPATRPVGVALVLSGLLIPALVVAGTLSRLSIGPLGGAWYVFLLVTGHQIGLYTAVVLALLAACFVAALRITLARRVGAEAPGRR
jgi:hypothetical protein